MADFAVCILANDLVRRLAEHRAKVVAGFTQTYRLDKLVYYETTPDVRSAIAREKQVKGWRREKKLALIESVNPTWRDLSEDWE